jgi:hypothetical protein
MSARSGSTVRGPIWLLGAAALALGAATIWWFARGPGSASERAAEASRAVAQTPDPMGYVVERRGKTDPRAVKELVDAYGQWADRPDAIEARKEAITTLLAQPNVKLAVESVMAAVEEDQTPRLQDPLWPHLVQSVSKVWDAVTIKFGLDRLALETRAKPKDLMLASLAAMTDGNGVAKLTDQQRMTMAADLIDAYPTLTPEQKPEVEQALGQLAGNDVVEIMAGRGIGPGAHLKAADDAQRALEAAMKTLPHGAAPGGGATAN